MAIIETTLLAASFDVLSKFLRGRKRQRTASGERAPHTRLAKFRHIFSFPCVYPPTDTCPILSSAKCPSAPSITVNMPLVKLSFLIRMPKQPYKKPPLAPQENRLRPLCPPSSWRPSRAVNTKMAPTCRTAASRAATPHPCRPT